MPALPSIIAPSILAANFGAFESEVRDIAACGADWIHIDVMDGTFVPPITFGDNAVIKAEAACSIPLDVHLMIVKPENHIETFAKAGASSLTVHQEVCPNLHRTLGAIRAAGMKAGVAINPATPATQIFDVLEVCDLVLIMTVNPGWGGQKFITQALQKIEAVRSEIERRKLSLHIEVDGGIAPETGRSAKNAGASAFVAGTSIFGQKDRAAAIKTLREAVK